MKTLKIAIIAFLCTFVLVGLLSAQSTLEIGAVGYSTDMTGVYGDGENGFASVGNQANKYAPTTQAYINYIYSMKLDPIALKLGLYLEDFMGFYQADVAPYAFQMAGKLEPSGEVIWQGLDIRVSFPLVTFNPTDKSGINELKYAYKSYNYGYTSTASPDYANNYFWVMNYDKITYKFSFDKTTSLTVGAEADTQLVPVQWLLDVKPQVSFVYGPAQLDFKYAIYNNDSPTPYLDMYLEPKVAVDFTNILGIGVLKAFVASRVSVATTRPASASFDTGKPWNDVSLTPGVSYKFPFGLYLEGNFKFAKLTSDKTNNLPNDKNTEMYFEPQLKVSYTLSF